MEGMTDYHVTVQGTNGEMWQATVTALSHDIREALAAAVEIAEKQQDAQEPA